MMEASFGVQGLMRVGGTTARIFKALLTFDPMHTTRGTPPALRDQLSAGQILANAQLRRLSSRTHVVETQQTASYGVPMGDPGAVASISARG